MRCEHDTTKFRPPRAGRDAQGDRVSDFMVLAGTTTAFEPFGLT